MTGDCVRKGDRGLVTGFCGAVTGDCEDERDWCGDWMLWCRATGYCLGRNVTGVMTVCCGEE